MGPELTFNINLKSIIRLLAMVIILLLLGNLFGVFLKYGMDHDTVFGLVPMFDMNREQNIPTVIAFLFLFTNAFLLFVIAQTIKIAKTM